MLGEEEKVGGGREELFKEQRSGMETFALSSFKRNL